MNSRFLASIPMIAAVIATLWSVPPPASAQTVRTNSAAATTLPRTTDGKPDLTGFWSLAALRYNGDLAEGKESEVPYTPEGLAAFKNHDAKDDPTGFCLPPGMPRMMHSPFPMMIMQSPGYVAMLFEYNRIWRLIYTDGRPHHSDVEETFFGDSVGKWEGDTLVVETVGLNDRSWLDTAGHQHTAEMRVTERIRRTAIDNIEYEITVHDPKMYSKPWTHKGNLKPEKATKGLPELLEYFCTENNKDIPHLISTKPGNP